MLPTLEGIKYMSTLSLLGILGVVHCSSIIPGAHTHTLHEKRESHHAWRRNAPVEASSIIPLRIGLMQQRLDDGTAYEKLMSVSHPDSPNYGKFLSSDEVHSLFAPTEEATNEVVKWLVESGLERDDILQYQSKAWLAAQISAEKFRQLFHADLHEYEHKATGEMRVGCDEYHLPNHLKRHIDYITPGVAMSGRLRKRNMKHSVSHSAQLQRRAEHSLHEMPAGGNSGDDVAPVNAADLKDLRHCGTVVSVACLRALYGLPKPTRHDAVNSLGMNQIGSSYAQDDLDEFFTKYAPEIPNGTHPILISIDGGRGPANRTDKFNGGEPELDLQAAWPLIYPQTITMYQSDDPPTAAAQLNQTLPGYLNMLLDAVDGSYCESCAFGECGDSEKYDPHYPNPVPGGFNGTRQCGIYNLTRVLSISYGQGEQDLPVAYTKRTCNEFMKLALQGHTIITAAGDNGVASYGRDTHGACLSGCGLNASDYRPGENCPYKDMESKIFHPSNPGNCPYVLSVGATVLYANQSILDAESAAYLIFNTTTNKYFATGGGFSNYFPRPDYQKDALNEYFHKHDPGYPFYFADDNATNIGNNNGIYNRGGRGYPDVSANGAKYPGVKWAKYQNGTVHTDTKFFGTSLSTPIWGAIITLINEERTADGKGPVGFVNPVLYQHPEVFNDIVNGTNPGCNTTGFTAVEGWDPLTGLGTPNYPKLLDVFMKLP